jgi:ribosomal protein L7/L12
MAETSAVFAILAFILGVVAFSMAVIALGSRSGAQSNSGYEARLARLEQRVAAIAAHVGAPSELAPSGSADVLALLDEGNRIGAIKLYREQTGAGLEEARDAVEELASGRIQP